MELKGKIVDILLNELGFSKNDLEKVKAVLDNVEVKNVGGSTVVEIRLNKISVILENNKRVY